MTPAMTAAEQLLLESVLQHSEHYLEFGCGGSTLLATRHVKSSVLSVETDRAWISKVKDSLRGIQSTAQTDVIFADIGQTGKLGYPIDPSARHRWPAYYTDVWKHGMAAEIDVVLVDGRFRVASFISALLNGGDEILLLIHDFRSRPEYHVVGGFAREIASSGDLSLFVRAANFEQGQAQSCLAEFAYDPR